MNHLTLGQINRSWPAWRVQGNRSSYGRVIGAVECQEAGAIACWANIVEDGKPVHCHEREDGHHLCTMGRVVLPVHRSVFAVVSS